VVVADFEWVVVKLLREAGVKSWKVVEVLLMVAGIWVMARQAEVLLLRFNKTLQEINVNGSYLHCKPEEGCFGTAASNILMLNSKNYYRQERREWDVRASIMMYRDVRAC
jgi:hypothetical protein